MNKQINTNLYKINTNKKNTKFINKTKLNVCLWKN